MSDILIDNPELRKAVLDAAIKVLNEAYHADPGAMRHLMRACANCNDRLADHPTVQVHDDRGTVRVRPIGIINGILGALTGSCVAECYDDDGGLLMGFTAYVEPPGKCEPPPAAPE